MKDSTIFIIWLLAASAFSGIVYAAYKFGFLYLLLAAIVIVFAAAMYAIRNNKIK